MWFNGQIVRWAEARVHIWSETAARGANVFEGIRAYWHEETATYYACALPEHLRRLYQSAKLLRFPTAFGADALSQAMADLLYALDFDAHAYLRPTLYLDDSFGGGVGALDVTAGAYVLCFRMPHPDAATGIRCGVSTWHRPSDLTLSPRVKSGAGFMSLRLARIEAAERGFDDAILLNERGTVAEASGDNIFIVRSGVAITPPVGVGLLEGVTRGLLVRLLPEALGIPVVEREIGRSELYAADEVFLCGTLHEIQPVIDIDGFVVGEGSPGPVTVRLRELYRRHCQAGPEAPAGWLQPLAKVSR
jgi:branched-chain amino acid aminotransferase